MNFTAIIVVALFYDLLTDIDAAAWETSSPLFRGASGAIDLTAGAKGRKASRIIRKARHWKIGRRYYATRSG
jgi:hypothetical protein